MAGFLKAIRKRAALRVRGSTAVSADALVAAIGDASLAKRLSVRVSARARRVSLRVDPGSGQIILVQPVRASARSVLDFTAAQRGWIADHLANLPTRIEFADGATIPINGAPHVVRFVPEQRGGVWCGNGEVFVAGRAEHGARRLTDWLKAQAKAVIGPTVRTMATELDCKVERIGVRDTSSRWGSCTHSGRLSFSWRLILAPRDVLTYVIAHEVAHLKHMDHGPAFWRTVEKLLVGSSVNMASARHWLRVHGAVLHRYG